MSVCIPRTQMTTIFEGQPPQTRPFLTKMRVNLVLGVSNIYIYICVLNTYIYICIYQSHGSNGISSDIGMKHQGRLANRLRAATLNRARLGNNSSCFLVILGHRISTNDEHGRYLGK